MRGETPKVSLTTQDIITITHAIIPRTGTGPIIHRARRAAKLIMLTR